MFYKKDRHLHDDGLSNRAKSKSLVKVVKGVHTPGTVRIIIPGLTQIIGRRAERSFHLSRMHIATIGADNQSRHTGSMGEAMLVPADQYQPPLPVLNTRSNTQQGRSSPATVQASFPG